MRTEDQLRKRVRMLEQLRDQSPIDVAVRNEIAVRVDELKRVLEQWPYTHVFELWTKTSGQKQATCALCGRDEDDPLHSEASTHAP